MAEFSVSIVIPCQAVNSYTKECLKNCLALNYDSFDIFLLPDNEQKLEPELFDDRIKIIPTGSVKPSVKRNQAIDQSTSDIIAFIDSDAYPADSDWLTKAIKYFKQSEVGMVGGPNLTPPEDTLGQHASGDIFSSFAATGPTALRYLARQKLRRGLPVKEMPSCNLLVKRDLAQAVKGFDAKFMTGEDAKFCFQIRKLGKKIINAPDVVVYHHRRQLFWGHFKQVWIYGRDKAWLIKEDFSIWQLYYFIPSFFVLGLLAGFFIWHNLALKTIWQTVVSIYLIGILLASLKNIKTFVLVFVGTVFTHIIYGLAFLYGLSIKHK